MAPKDADEETTELTALQARLEQEERRSQLLIEQREEFLKERNRISWRSLYTGQALRGLAKAHVELAWMVLSLLPDEKREQG